MDKLLSDDDIFGSSQKLLSDDDIFGTTKPPAPASGVSAREDETDDARASRGFGRSAYMNGLIDMPGQAPARAAPKPEPVSEFDDETIGDLAKRRGQEVVQGASGVFQSIVRARGIDDATLAAAIQEDAPSRIQEAGRKVRSYVGILERGISDDGQSEMTDEERASYEKRLSESLTALEQWSDVEESGPAFAGNRTKFAEETAENLKVWTDKTFGVPPRDDSFWSEVAHGAGSMVAFVLPTVASGGLGTPITAQMGADAAKTEAYDRAIAHGAKERDAQIAASIAGFMGTAEAVPIARALERLPEPLQKDVLSRMGRFLSRSVKGSVEEGVQEGLAGIGQNLIAKNVYDPDQEVITEDVGKQALVGAVLGGFLGGAGSAFSGPRDEKNLPTLTERQKASPVPDEVIQRGRSRLEQIKAKRNGTPVPDVPDVSDSDVVQPKLDDAPSTSTAPKIQTPERADQASVETESRSSKPEVQDRAPVAPSQDANGEFEDLPEIGDDGKETGRTVRFDLATGTAKILEPDAAPSAPVVDETTPKPADKWAIRNKETGATVLETDDPNIVDLLDTSKFEAVPTAQKSPEGEGEVAQTKGDENDQETNANDGRAGNGDPANSSTSGTDLPRSDVPEGRNSGSNDGTSGSVRANVGSNDQASTNEAVSGNPAAPPDVGDAGAPAVPGLENSDQEKAAAVPPFSGSGRKGKIKPPSKRPFTFRMKGPGVDPDGPLATELRHAGITAQNTPGLFRKGGLTDGDNLPAVEWQEYAGIIGTDDNGYLSKQGIVDALTKEFAGKSVQDSEQIERQGYENAREQSKEEAKNVTPEVVQETQSVEEKQGGRYIPPPRFDTYGDASGRFEAVVDAVNRSLDDVGLTDVLSSEDVQWAIGALERDGGSVNDVVWESIRRSIQRADGQPETRKSEDIPFPDPVERTRGTSTGSASSKGKDVPQVDAGAKAGSGSRPESPENNQGQVPSLTSERTDAGIQSVIPGAEQSTDRSNAAKAADQRRELEARQRQSKKGTTAPQSGAGPLFGDEGGTQGDIFDNVESQSPSTPSVSDEQRTAADRKWTSRTDAERLRMFDDAGVTGQNSNVRKAFSELDPSIQDSLAAKFDAEPATIDFNKIQSNWNSLNAKDKKGVLVDLSDQLSEDQIQEVEASISSGGNLPKAFLDLIARSLKSATSERNSLTDEDLQNLGNKSVLRSRDLSSVGEVWDGLSSEDRKKWADRVPNSSPLTAYIKFSQHDAQTRSHIGDTVPEELLAELKPKSKDSKAKRRLTKILRDAWVSRENLPDDANDDFIAATAKVSAARKALADEFSDDVANSALEKIEADHASEDGAGSKQKETQAQKPAAETAEKIQDFGEKIGGARKDTADRGYRRKPKSGKDDRPAWMKKFLASEKISNGKPTGEFRIIDRNGRPVTRSTFNTIEEAEAAIPLAAVAQKHVVRLQGDGTFAIMRKVGSRGAREVVEGGFETQEAAMAHMALNADAIISKKIRIDEADIHPALEEAIRLGEERRADDKNVGAKDFSEVFGFRGVEFGNWNNGPERQLILNQAYDAFLDLAEILKVPPKALSLNGDLALAFGSRGSGLSAARAHYERNYGVINLTKIKGAGSLAHEWWHAVDHYFGRQDGKASSEKITNERGDQVFDARDREKDYVSHSTSYKTGLRPEVKDAIKKMVEAVYYRQQEFTEDVSTREEMEKRDIARVQRVTKALRDELSKPYPYGRKKDPATDEQLKVLDAAIAKIEAGKPGEMIELPSKANGRFSIAPMAYAEVAKIAEVYKQVRGRQAYRKAQNGRWTGPAMDLQYAIQTKERAEESLAEARQEKVKTRRVRTEFASEAWKLDRGRSDKYWVTNHEMTARAFEAFVYDRLKDVDARNDFLSYEKRNDLPEYVLFNVKPYPEGDERTSINEAFQEFFDTIQTEETDSGTVRMYQRPLDGEKAVVVLSDLQSRLKKLMIRGVDLSYDPTLEDQGATDINPNGDISIVIGATLDGLNTLNHEAIHVLRARGLFTNAEWKTLSAEAKATWLKKYDIANRYPDLDAQGQIEEAIAEAFAEFSTKEAPTSKVRAVFAKVKRFFKALGQALQGQGIKTANDIFQDVETGAVGGRDIDVTADSLIAARKAQRPSSKVRPKSAQGRSATAAATHSTVIPDRAAWDALAARNVSVLDRAAGLKGAYGDSFDRFRVKIQDRMLPILRAEQAVETLTGQKTDEVDSPYLAEERYSSKVGARITAVEEQFTKPIISLIAKAPKPIEVTDQSGEKRTGVQAVSLWLMARHAKERNAHIASINDKMPDGGSGLTNAEADAIIKSAQPFQKTLDAIGTLTDNLGQNLIDVREQSGLLTKQEANAWRKMYEHYVPLQRFAEDDMFDAIANEGGTGMGRRYNVRGSEARQAMGRSTEAFDPLSMLITQAHEVAARAEKNQVAKAMYEFAKANPNPAMWEVSQPETQRFFNSSTGKVEDRVVGPTARQLSENEMALKIDGKEHRITFNDPRLAKSMGQVGTNDLGAVTRFVGMFSQLFSAVNTMLSPSFVVVNGFRDMITAQVNLGESGQEIRGKLRKKAITSWVKAARGANKAMKGDHSTEYSKWFKEYEEAGGKVHFWQIEDPEGLSSDFQKRVKREARGRVTGTLSKLVLPSTRDNPALAWIERINLTVDNAVRLSVYVEARKNGWSKEKAASLSKNLTVNFNRKGELGSTLNAWYPFMNAAIQGSHVMLKAMTNRQVQGIVGAMFMYGFANDLLNAALSEEDDDGELEYDQLPNHISERNVILAVPGSDETFATVPVPYGYNLFLYAGQQMGKMLRGVKNPGEATSQMFKVGIEGFAPVGGNSLFQSASPMLGDIAFELATNQDWLGRPIRPENPFGDYGPQSHKEYNASGASSAISRGLNAATGGSPIEQGLIDISPEYIDHIAKHFFGGAGRFAGRTYGLGERAVEGTLGDTEAHEIPLLRVLRTESGEFLNQNRFFEFRDAVQEARAQLKLAQEVGIPLSPEMIKLAGLSSDLMTADKARRAAGDKMDVIYADPTLSNRLREAKLKPIRDIRNKAYIKFNRQFISIMGAQAE